MGRRRALARWLTVSTLAVAALPVVLEPSAAATRDLAAATVATPTGDLHSQTVAVEAPARGAVVEVPVPAGTQMVGVSWTAGFAEVEVATPTDDGWSEWAHLHADGPEQVEVGARTGVGPVWLGGDGVETVGLRITDGAPVDLQVEAMRVDVDPSARAATRAAAPPATPAGGPAIHPRSDWAPGGWRTDTSGCGTGPSVASELTFAVVHHTDGSNTYTPAQVPTILAGMYRFHTGTNGWCDIGYSLLVDRFGGVWEGRSGGLDNPVGGGHAMGFNSGSVGVAVMGSFISEDPSPEAMTALRDVLAWKLAAHGVDPTGTARITSNGSPRYPAGRVVTLPTIQGHLDSGLTACPGARLYDRLPTLRQDVAARIAATAEPGRWAPATTGPAFFGRIESEVSGHTVRNGRPGTYTSLVVRAGWPRDQLATGLVLSSTTDVSIGVVDRIYRAAFDREAETGGLQYWVDQRRRGMTLARMAQLFSGTPEFRGMYDGLADGPFVTEVYRNILGRDPEPSGQQYWVDRLARGLTRHQLLAAFSESAEHRTRRRVDGEVTRAFLVLLDRAATPAERQAWRGEYAGGATGTDLVAMILASGEYASR